MQPMMMLVLVMACDLAAVPPRVQRLGRLTAPRPRGPLGAMTVSHRSTHITGGGSDGWYLFRKARRMIAQGRPVIELTIGKRDIRVDPRTLGAINGAPAPAMPPCRASPRVTLKSPHA